MDITAGFMRQKKYHNRRFRYRAASVLLAAVLFCCRGSVVSAAGGSGTDGTAREELQLYAQAAVLMDADSGRVLYGKNENEILPMASTTKIMTCIIALEYGDTDGIAEVSSYAAGMPKVRLGVSPGERYRLGDLLYSLMLESHNDSAVVIAEAVGGSVEGFAGMMNRKAVELGCKDTYFITPNGLDAAEDGGRIHSTTAADLARIMAYCVTDSPAKDRFLEITRTMSYDFCDADGSRSFHCDNHNAFLGMMEEALSGKTGFTNNAGYCYVGAVESGDRIFTVALLACGWPDHKTYKWSDMKTLAQYGMERYAYRDIYEPQQFREIPVADGIDGRTQEPYAPAFVRVEADDGGVRSLPYLLCEEDAVEIRVRVPDALRAPVACGEQVGAVEYYLNGSLVETYPVVTVQGAEEKTCEWICRYVLRRFLP